MKEHAGFLSLILAFVFALSASSARGETFTLQQAYEMAFRKAEGIQIARERVLQAEEDKNRARSTVLPKLTVNGVYQRSPKETDASGAFLLQPRDSYDANVTVEQPLFAGGKNSAGIRIARKGLEVARRDFNLSTEELLLETAEAFYEVLKAGKNAEAQRRNVERLKEHRRLSELRYKVGEVTESVFLRAQAELAGAQAELVAVENDLATRKKELQLLTDLPEGFEVMEPAAPEIPREAVPDLLQIAFEKREDLERTRLQEEIAADQVAFARGNFLPTLDADWTYFYRDTDPQRSFFIQDSWIASLRLEFPIFEGGLRRAELAQAHSQLEQSRLERTRLRKEIDLDVTRSSLALEAVTRELESRREQQRFAEKNFEMVSKQFTFGLATNIDVLDANQTLIEAERDVITATYDRHVSILRLQRSVGIFLESILGEDLPDV